MYVVIASSVLDST